MKNKKLFLFLLFINIFDRNLKSFDYCLKFKMGTLVQLERNHKLKNYYISKKSRSVDIDGERINIHIVEEKALLFPDSTFN